ncbi:DUF1801 domain-containing protein [Telluribacter sp. SYSU D00476]|uniref:DUF1801 domain-containing protein n=1 Tax=Telluribacter sp. SYSU D00476 TaxID=2811430 RepID=UPI0021D43504|nr:DUF1801 domain-containing protein [Telluribacter sp. SYSU D00476]
MTAEDYFVQQNPQIRRTLYALHKVILLSEDNITCKLNWGIPFYYYRGSSWCYLAYIKKWNCVEIGFTKGHLLGNEAGVLLERGRKTVRSIEFKTYDDFVFREEAIREVIQEALLLQN